MWSWGVHGFSGRPGPEVGWAADGAPSYRKVWMSWAVLSKAPGRFRSCVWSTNNPTQIEYVSQGAWLKRQKQSSRVSSHGWRKGEGGLIPPCPQPGPPRLRSLCSAEHLGYLQRSAGTVPSPLPLGISFHCSGASEGQRKVIFQALPSAGPASTNCIPASTSASLL